MTSRNDCTSSSLCFEPVIKDWLPPQTPQLSDNAEWFEVEPSKFYYTLGSDRKRFDYWQTAVLTTIYDVTENFDASSIDIINAYKFSPFFLGIQCYTTRVNDGCCMASDSDGGLCVFRNNDNEMDTYRFTN